MRPHGPAAFLALLLATALLPGGALGQGISADLDGLVVTADARSGEAKPQQTLVFELRLEAQEGAKRRVSFEVVEAPPGFRATAPAPITLPGPAGGVAVVPFMVLASYRNGYVDDAGKVVLRVHAAPVEGEDAPTSRDLTFEVASRGVYVPAPAAALLAPLLAAVALGVSRTRP